MKTQIQIQSIGTTSKTSPCQTGEGEPTVNFEGGKVSVGANTSAEESTSIFTGAVGTPPPLDDEEIATANANDEWEDSPDTDHLTLDGIAISDAERERQRDVLNFLERCEEHLSPKERAWTLRDIAEIHAQLGNKHAAYECLTIAKELLPQDASILEANYRAALRINHSGQKTTALEALLNAEDSPAEHRDSIHKELAHLYQRQGNTEKALEHLQSLNDTSFNLAIALQLSTLLVQSDNKAGAADVLEQAAAKASDPLSSELRARALRYHLDCEDSESARSLIQALSNSNAFSATISATLDQAAAQLKDPALRLARRKKIENPTSTELLDQAIVGRFRSSESSRAQSRVLKPSKTSFKETLKSSFSTNWLLSIKQRKKWDELADLLEEQASVVVDKSIQSTFFARAGDIHARHRNNFSSALVSYERALSFDPGNRRALEGAGRIYRKDNSVDALITMHKNEMALHEEESTAYAICAFRPWRNIGVKRGTR